MQSIFISSILAALITIVSYPIESLGQGPVSDRERIFMTALEQHPVITRQHFHFYCGQCHTEWRSALSSDNSFADFMQGMRPIVLFEMKRGLMPKADAKYQMSAQLKARMIKFLEDNK
jgi:hypothetical protein